MRRGRDLEIPPPSAFEFSRWVTRSERNSQMPDMRIWGCELLHFTAEFDFAGKLRYSLYH